MLPGDVADGMTREDGRVGVATAIMDCGVSERVSESRRTALLGYAHEEQRICSGVRSVSLALIGAPGSRTTRADETDSDTATETHKTRETSARPSEISTDGLGQCRLDKLDRRC